MQPFQEVHLEKYIDALCQRFSLPSIKAVPGSFRFQDNSFTFQGRMPRMQKNRQFIVPFECRFYGVITARSLLSCSNTAESSWLLNGQATGQTREHVYIGGSSDSAVSLHASKEMLQKWTHEPLTRPNQSSKSPEALGLDCANAFDDYVSRGLYEEEVAIGHYADRGESTLSLCLQPISSDRISFDENDAPTRKAQAR